MKDKPFYTSKAMWSGILLAVFALYQMAMTGTIDVGELTTLLTGTGIIGIRDAL